MPSSTRTPEQSRSELIARLAGNANTAATLLSVIGILPSADQERALLTAAEVLRDTSRDLATLVIRGAA